MKKIICSILLFFGCVSFAQAQGWDKTYTSPLGDTTWAFTAVETFDSGYVFAGGSYAELVRRTDWDYHLWVSKVDKRGNTIWQYNPANLIVGDTVHIFQTADSGLIVVASQLVQSDSAQSENIVVVKLNKNGVEQSRKFYLDNNWCHGADMSVEKDRVVLVTHAYGISHRLIGSNILQLSANGDSLSCRFFSGQLRRVAFGGDGQIYAGAFRRDYRGRDGIIKFNRNGDSLWLKEMYYDNYLRRANDGRILVNSHLKLDYDGQILFNGNPRPDNLENTPSGAISNQIFTQRKGDKSIYALRKYSNNGRNKNLYFIKKDSIGRQVLAAQVIENGVIDWFWESLFSDIIPTSDGGFLLIGHTAGIRYGFGKARLVKLLAYQTVVGKIYVDSTQNCQFDAAEKGFPECIIAFEKNNDIRWAVTDAKGNYEAQCDTGVYTIKPMPTNANWRFCTPSVTRRFSTTNASDTVNFAAQAAFYCPQLQVGAGTWGLRFCQDNTYSVNYVNNGTAIAHNAYIEITLDSFMEFRQATIPLSSQVGQRLRFDIGDVDFGTRGRFDLTVFVKCSTRLANRTLCLESRIFPDSLCTPITGWSGANVVVSGRCAQDSVEFTIRNTGNAPTGNLRRIIIEDQVMLTMPSSISLPPFGTLIQRIRANGSTYRIVVEQVPNNPRSTFATAFVEQCNGRTTGNVLPFPDADSDPTLDIQCLPIRSSYDPNDKIGYPIGTGTNGVIGQNTDIEYVIRFQNTGTDTAFIVILRDTLPPQLDIASLEMNTASHPYTWNLEGKGILSFTFDNIRLLDSFRNEPKSHGFVKFRIKQKKDLPIGTKI